MARGPWSNPDNDAELARLCGLGWSYGEIGNKLGVSRNAAIGRASRLHIDDGHHTSGHNPYRQKAVRTRKFAERPAPVVVTDIPDPPPSQRVATINLTDKTCRWPLDNPGDKSFGFCGREPEPHRPYCAVHCQRAYDKPSTQRSNAKAQDVERARAA